METISVSDNVNRIFEADDYTAEGKEINADDFPSKEPTGISDAPRLNDKGQMTNDKRGGVYDLQGRRINAQGTMHHAQLTKGIYIENGRKVAIK
jgi:hypothetical protein